MIKPVNLNILRNIKANARKKMVSKLHKKGLKIGENNISIIVMIIVCNMALESVQLLNLKVLNKSESAS